MAGNKKKKKVIANPARGFATTSIASKTKIQEEDVPPAEESVGATSPKGDGSPAASDSRNEESGRETERQLSELSPEELEKHLDESQLQIIIDKHRDNIERTVSRNVSKLQTERRLLRPQVDALRTRKWLSPELIQNICDQTDIACVVSGSSKDGISKKNIVVEPSDDELLVRVWSLHNTLARLHFPRDLSWKALEEVIQGQAFVSEKAPSAASENVLGLEQCLDWFACHAHYDYRREISSYVEAEERIPPLTNSAVSEPPAKSICDTITNGASQTDVDDKYDQASSDEESDSLSSCEPEEMIERYVALQTRRFHLEQPVRSKISRQDSSLPTSVADKIVKIDAKLKEMKNDILFEEYEAQKEWNIARIKLTQEAADRRRLGVSGFSRNVNSSENSISNRNTQEITRSGEDDESHGMLDGLFLTTDPTEKPIAEGKVDQASGDPVSDSIEIKNFGIWKGSNPRRVFEDACHARDHDAQMKWRTLSESSFSVRLELQIDWSYRQHYSLVPSFPGVSLVLNGSQTRIGMEGISCPDKVQAEAYISTISLFLISTFSSKEEKSYLRLPAIWRNLWQDLTDRFKTQVNTEELSLLRSLRDLIKEANLKDSGTSDIANIEVKADTEFDVKPSIIDHNVRQVMDGSKRQDPAVSAAWQSRIARPAYRAIAGYRKNLPIWKFRDQLLQGFQQNQVTIVCGETGCGKSTQVPAYIFEQEASQGRPCKIICAEPRRISAITLAHRVSEELGERKGDLGTARSSVGYSIRLESKTNAQTSIVYATTGVVMRMLENPRGVDQWTHLVLDEVHERSIESDFLLIILKKLLSQHPALRVVLMSATVDADKFSKYMNNAPVLTIPGRTFPVETRFLEDVIETTAYYEREESQQGNLSEDHSDEENDQSSGEISCDKAYSRRTKDALAKYNEYRIDYNLIARLLEFLATDPRHSQFSKAILVFLPGIAEIRTLHSSLSGNPIFSQRWNIYPLHSAIATENQAQAFVVPPDGTRKIVLATNIAETGITIPDVTCVIDTGKHKEIRFDEKRQLSRLIEAFISRANAKQRRGRAGRVQEGLCFHLFTKHRHDKIMPAEQTPEILRLSLQDIILRVKICKLGAIEQALSEALDPPSEKNIRRAMDALVDVKALTFNEELTPLGRQLVKLPLDVFLGKLIIIGTVFCCVDVCITIAAVLSSKSPFVAPFGSRAQADSARLAFRKGDSDLLTTYNAYCAWKRVCTANAVSEQQYCRTNYLSSQVLANIEELKGQLLSTLAESGFLTLDEAERKVLHQLRFNARQRVFVQVPPKYNVNSDNEMMVNSLLACSFYPRLLKRDGKGWRSIAKNQPVTLHPTSVVKSAERAPQWTSFYHIMQSSSKHYNAHENSPVEDIAIALLCGSAEFKMYSGAIVIDGNRIRFTVDEWRTLLAIKNLRTNLQQIISLSVRKPGFPLSSLQQEWMDMWQRIFAPEERFTPLVSR